MIEAPVAMSVLPESSTLHLFAQGAWDFLVAAAALSAVVALICLAADEFLRPRAHRRHVQAWVLHHGRLLLAPEPDDRDGEREDVVRRWCSMFPKSFYGLPPDQLCAQIIRRLQAYAEQQDHLRRPERGRLRSDDADQDVAREAWIESLVDELQSDLVQDGLRRSYLTATGVVGLLLGLMLAGTFASYSSVGGAVRAPDPDTIQWVLLTVVFGAVAVLLSPIIQGAVTRLVRSR